MCESAGYRIRIKQWLDAWWERRLHLKLDVHSRPLVQVKEDWKSLSECPSPLFLPPLFFTSPHVSWNRKLSWWFSKNLRGQERSPDSTLPTLYAWQIMAAVERRARLGKEEGWRHRTTLFSKNMDSKSRGDRNGKTKMGPVSKFSSFQNSSLWFLMVLTVFKHLLATVLWKFYIFQQKNIGNGTFEAKLVCLKYELYQRGSESCFSKIWHLYATALDSSSCTGESEVPCRDVCDNFLKALTSDLHLNCVKRAQMGFWKCRNLTRYKTRNKSWLELRRDNVSNRRETLKPNGTEEKVRISRQQSFDCKILK